jgi:hyperosmotically inducible protein
MGQKQKTLARRNTMKPLNQFVNLFLVILLVSALGCVSTATKEGTGEYVDDSVITAKVKTEIFKDDSLKSGEINVETFKGVVQLSGFVNSEADIARAVEVARSVKGVTSVKNDMHVKGNQ